MGDTFGPKGFSRLQGCSSRLVRSNPIIYPLPFLQGVIAKQIDGLHAGELRKGVKVRVTREQDKGML